MATKKTSVENADAKRIDPYKSEYKSWLNELEKYHVGRFDENYRQYTAYTDTQGTESKISDPIAPELTERVVNRIFEEDPRFIAFGRGHDVPQELANVIQGTASYLWANPDTIQSTGTSHSKMKVLGREFMVTGNCATEIFFNVKSNNPDYRIIPIEDVIFDPSRTLKTSPRYYIRQRVSLEDIEAMKEVTENGKVVGGIFKEAAVTFLKDKYENPNANTTDRSSNLITRSGSRTADTRQTKLIELVSMWEGKKLIQFGDWEVVLREVEDPMNIGDKPIDLAMDIEVPKQPYGFSLLDFLNGLTAAKDMLLNQVIDWGAKALNPPLFVDPNLPTISKQSLRNAWRLGGLVFANPQQAEHKSMPPLPPEGFALMSYIQQRAESASGIGAYVGGVPNQANDKTRGTARGIEALISQGQPPIRDRQKNIEESIIEPVINKMLKMAGRLMGSNEKKFVLIGGESPKWVQVTKGILTGKVTLKDLLVSQIIDEETFQELIQEGAEEDKVVFDVDWVIRVESGSLAQRDKEEEMANIERLSLLGSQLGIPLNKEAIFMDMARIMGKKDPERYLMNPEEAQPTPEQMAAQAESEKMRSEMVQNENKAQAMAEESRARVLKTLSETELNKAKTQEIRATVVSERI